MCKLSSLWVLIWNVSYDINKVLFLKKRQETENYWKLITCKINVSERVYVCVCVSACLCEREIECVCVCVYVSVRAYAWKINSEMSKCLLSR